MGIGIGIYFRLGVEPPILWGYVAAGFALLAGAIAIYRPLLSLLFLLLCTIAVGFCAAQIRTYKVAAPVLGWPYYGQISGRVVKIDRSQSDRIRLTLAMPKMPPISAPRTPNLIRISLPKDALAPAPDQLIQITAYVAPPTGPAEPGGYDFQRRAWFHGLGGVGYARDPPRVLGAAATQSYEGWVYALRKKISAGLQFHLRQPAGGFAAAIVVGDRSAVDRNALRDLRRSNLAHLLAISGLHMGLLVGVVFFAIRTGFALIAPLALRVPSKKIAACFALIVGGIYLQLSGMSVASERAFSMVAVMLGAVMLDRPALSLRAVALAGILILLRRPEYLLEPGFQMSFAATSALIVTFRKLNVLIGRHRFQNHWRRIVWFVGSLMISSLVAGLATAPFAAYHFNQLPHYGVIANTLSLPLMGMVVMPSVVLAALLYPLGLEWIAMVAMGYGISAILVIAEQVAHWPGAVSLIIKPQAWVFTTVACGFVLFVILQGSMRLFGAIIIGFGMWHWAHSTRPEVLISANGRLLGVLTDSGQRSVNRARGNAFTARIWTENDGLPFDQARQSTLYTAPRDGAAILTDVYYGWSKHITPQEANALCAQYVIVILPQSKVKPKGKCQFFGRNELRKSGAIALNNAQATRVITAKQLSGRRFWNEYKIRKRLLPPKKG